MINPVETQKERILLVECDSQVSDLIAQQTLIPLGYQVDVIPSASSAIKEIESIAPDIIITNLYLPEISGKDLLVALASQGIKAPIIVIAPKGHESDVLQAFRLGAVNFISYPIREAEIVKVVEDTLKQHRKQNELEMYSQRIDQTKEVLERRIRDLTEIFSISKFVVSNISQQLLYEKLTNVALHVTQSDAVWMSVMDVNKEKFYLVACVNADRQISSKLNLPFEDKISSLIAASGQVISIHSEALKRFDLPTQVKAAIATPIKWNGEIVGIFVAVRNSLQPFTKDQQLMLEMVADYASILIKNNQRFYVQEQRLDYLQQSGIYATIESDLKNDLLQQSSLELRTALKNLKTNLEVLSTQGERRLSLKQTDAINAIHEETDILMDIANSMVRIHQGGTSRILENINLNETVRELVNRSQAIAHISNVSIKLELPAQPTIVTVYPSQITKVIEGLISNALKYGPTKAQLIVKVENKDDQAMLSVQDQGEGISESLAEKLFDRKANLFGDEAKRFGGIGISLPMMKEIITAHKGEIWVDSGFGKGFNINFSLPKKITYSEQK